MSLKPLSVLYIEFDENIIDANILKKYHNKIKTHNLSVSNDLYPDSGFDIFNPKQVEFNKNQTQLINFGIKSAMYTFTNAKNIPVYSIVYESFNRRLNTNIYAQPFQIFPRSSIWKTGFRLANNTGIIDSGYRGHLFGSMHNNNNCKNNLIYNNRYLQICKPDLLPFYIQIVDKINNDSKRGNSGLGSTGN
tara:strand:+ start:411 stop:983 length:573 start_codon:yes stop_codon:yes gene_type:complete